MASEASRLQIGAANCNQRGGRHKVTFRHWAKPLAHFSRTGGYGNRTPDLLRRKPRKKPLHHQPFRERNHYTNSPFKTKNFPRGSYRYIRKKNLTRKRNRLFWLMGAKKSPSAHRGSEPPLPNWVCPKCQVSTCRAARLLSTFPSDRCCFNNKAWGPQASINSYKTPLVCCLECILTYCEYINGMSSFYHARMAHRAQHLRCSLCERSERGDNKLDKSSST